MYELSWRRLAGILSARRILALTITPYIQSRLQVQEKNADEVFQQFIYHTSSQQFRDRAMTNAKDARPADAALPNKDDATRDGQQAVQHLRTLAQILLTNSEARKLIQDFGLIGRDLFAQGASRAAERARPDPERMSKVDDSAVSPAGAVGVLSLQL